MVYTINHAYPFTFSKGGFIAIATMTNPGIMYTMFGYNDSSLSFTFSRGTQFTLLVSIFQDIEYFKYL
jgi:hypothetical protein